MSSPPFLICRIAGREYQPGAMEHWPTVQHGQSLLLVREPDNQHDAQAVSVWDRELKLGYIPRYLVGPVAIEMDRGRHFTAKCSKEPDGSRRVLVTYED